MNILTYVCICKYVRARVQFPCSKRSFKSRSSGEDSKPASFNAFASVSSLTTSAADRRRFNDFAQRLQEERFGHVGGPYDADVTLLLPTDLECPDYQLLEITINLVFLQDVLDETEAQTRGWTSAALFVDVLLQHFDSAELAPCQRSLGVPGLSDLRENSLDICVKRISHQSFVAVGLQSSTPKSEHRN